MDHVVSTRAVENLKSPRTDGLFMEVNHVVHDILLSYVLRHHRAASDVPVALRSSPYNSTSPMLTAPNASDSSNSGIFYLPLVSKIIIMVELNIALIHFILNALYFTRLRLPVPSSDVELTSVQAPDNSSNIDNSNITSLSVHLSPSSSFEHTSTDITEDADEDILTRNGDVLPSNPSNYPREIIIVSY